MNTDLPVIGVVLVIAILIVSLGIHEAAHGWVALKCGDTTARDLGRITLNPLPHIDPFLTILLPLLLYYSTGFVFGGAKPVPVNFHALRRPYRDMALVALAGPLSNFLIALVLFFVLKVTVEELGIWTEDAQGRTPLGEQVLYLSVFFNLVLAAFNLIPIPPLDGSRIMAWVLPQGMRAAYSRLEHFGMILVFVLIFSGVLSGPIRGAILAMYYVVEKTVTLGGLW